MTRTRWVVGSTFALGVVVAGMLIFWFFNRQAPEEANLQTAIEGVANTSGEPGNSSDTAEWAVTNQIGEFSYEEATGTFAGFRVDEELQGLGSNVAVGRTEAVTGSLSLDGSRVTQAEFTVDMTSITTDDSRRDNRALGAMKVEEFSTATFQLGSPIDLGEIPEEGTTITATATGDLTIAGITNPVEMPIEAQLTPQGLVVVGSTDITMSDYGVQVPQAPVLLSASEIATIEVQLWFVPAEGG